MKAFSQEVLARERLAFDRVDPSKLKFGFCGNIANCMYGRALPLRRTGLDVSIHIHPGDYYVMSHPVWEEFDGEAPEGDLTIENLRASVPDLPHVEDVFVRPWVDDRVTIERLGGSFLRDSDIKHFPSYLGLVRTLLDLQEKDALWGTQVAYIAYLANRPYVLSQSGGELWFEASRNDEMGALMRQSFAQARLILATNPWTFAQARRFGLDQVIYLPMMIDETVYAPGHGEARAQWEGESGGRFFVLTSSRLDERNKGSSVGLEGFARFSRSCPDARMVLLGWGNDMAKFEKALDELGIRDKVYRLPAVGKKRLRDYLRSADVFIDQFVLGYFGAAGLEAMASGLPVIGGYELEQYEALCDTGAPPISNARSAENVARHLVRLHGDVELRKNEAASLRQWFVDNHGSARRAEDYTAVLSATALSLPTGVERSPLRAELSEEERAYLAQGIKQAPPYPSYGF
jgi:glycosyltransferase involved in cell wall biosynthesis